ncbi:hypothetical protein LELG_02524 [Lodderomyces elongisporus NRRL YB-4239]|uniref:RRM domain-containing protein n=1 Tax=Lodderomyces elongisporus (strain ATCC 11503 / CBS 2605 / JCM 1781 / NBRC 1676 / NRRL YB-4239) TaxID=379508 RepID=A5DYT7_LODEL|nr:hypothetical protein LELG_02524 [Lodderomyces elongisporus NRRL YB-4239]
MNHKTGEGEKEKWETYIYTYIFKHTRAFDTFYIIICSESTNIYFFFFPLRFGELVRLDIPPPRTTDGEKFAFVEFKDAESCERALDLDGKQTSWTNGNGLVVQVARSDPFSRSERSSSSSYGRGGGYRGGRGPARYGGYRDDGYGRGGDDGYSRGGYPPRGDYPPRGGYGRRGYDDGYSSGGRGGYGGYSRGGYGGYDDGYRGRDGGYSSRSRVGGGGGYGDYRGSGRSSSSNGGGSGAGGSFDSGRERERDREYRGGDINERERGEERGGRYSRSPSRSPVRRERSRSPERYEKIVNLM